MSDSDPAVPLVQRALELRDSGEAFDVAELCSGRPDLIAAVQAALEMSEVLPQSLRDDPLLGAIFDDRYRLVEFIGAGAMGKVFAGRDESLGREIAVKVLQHGIFATDQRRQRFVREAKVLASLDHPHVVRIFDHGVTEDGFHFIVMEHLTGASLASVLEDQVAHRDEPRVPIWAVSGEATRRHDWLTQIAEWGVQLASALQSAHDSGIYHRDLKPSNIIIDANGNAHLLDFGIATREGEGSLTFGGTTLGTPWYMAPEQAADASDVNEQVDVYGLCATLYHLATFEPPYDGDYSKVLVDLQTKDPRPPKHVRAELPHDLCAIIEKGMDRDLRRRYRSAAELERDLRAFVAHMPVAARPLSPIGRRWRRIQARPLPWVAAAVVVVALVTTFFATSHFTRANREAADAAVREYRGLFAGWPPAVAFEGNLETRPLIAPDERTADIARADRILALRPDDQYSRMLRAALLLDDGQLAESAREIEYFGKQNDTGFFRELLTRYRNANATEKGAGAVRTDGLPKPETDVGRFVAAFHHARIKDYERADALLADATNHFAARYLRLSVMFMLGIRARMQSVERPDEFVTVEDEARDLATTIGFPTARTHYYIGSGRYGLRNYDSAIDPLRESVELSASFHAMYNLAGALRRVDRKQEAIQYYERASQLRPWNLNALRDLAQVKAEFGEFDEARLIVQRLPSEGHLIEPWHKEFLFGFIEALRAEAQVAGSDRDGALVSLERASQHYQSSLSAAADRADGRNKTLAGLADLQSIADPDRARVSAVARLLRGDPLNVHLLYSLRYGLKRLSIDEKLQGELIEVLGEMANALDRRRHQTRAADASAKKK